jgi:murein DD-endopeptidase MepM/ murein hydrolase activator NlpD
MTFPRCGLIAGVGPTSENDLAVIRLAQIDALKLRAHVNPASDLSRYRGAGIDTFLIQLLSSEPGREPTTPQAFVTSFEPAIEAFVREGVRDFEIHSEPNLFSRGYGVSWHSPAAFGDWYLEVAARLKAAFGPQVRAGFPGLTPPPPRLPGPEPAVSQRTFLGSCADAINQSDFLCCHVYWDTLDGLRSVDGGMRFIHQYLEAFPRIPLVVSEFANVDPGVDGAARGAQVAEFYLATQQYDACRYEWPGRREHWPRLQAAYALVLRSSDPTHVSLVWRDAAGRPSALVAPVGARPRMPSPEAMRFSWPTEFRYYTQFYGENQQKYYEQSYGRSLRGGHNGVDLHVRYDNPASSPIQACLDGIVTSRRMIETGYGHQVTVESDVADVGRVTLLYAHMTDVSVAEGERVEAGQVIGTAGMTGATTGPHLHLSAKVKGIPLPVNGDHLNARRYLDPLPPPRGKPRQMYARTYVLLPPNADAPWSQAVVNACWETRRFSLGGSADDAGIGDLDHRCIIAVNPEAWEEDLRTFLIAHYPGIIYVPVEAESPDGLRAALSALTELPTEPPVQPHSSRGTPRVDYERTYVLLPPHAGVQWASAVISGSWDRHRFTLGGSADDAGIGDVAYRRVIAINPTEWAEDLWRFFETYYPGVLYVPVEAQTPDRLAEKLRAF